VVAGPVTATVMMTVTMTMAMAMTMTILHEVAISDLDCERQVAVVVLVVSHWICLWFTPCTLIAPRLVP
jgi:hypothetical protein